MYRRNTIRVVNYQTGRYIYVDKPIYKMGHIYMDTKKSDFFTFKKRDYVFGNWVYLIEWHNDKRTEVWAENIISDQVNAGIVKLHAKPKRGKKVSVSNNMLEGDMFEI